MSSRKRHKFHILYKSGTDRVKDALDVRTLVRSQQKLHNLTKLMFDKQGRYFLRFQRRNILEFGGSASDTTDTETELIKMPNLGKNEKFIDQLVGWTAKTPMEKKLVLGILHKKNHKDLPITETATVTSGM